MYVVALDCSSSFCKASLIDKEGRILKFSSIPISLHNPKPGWYEHDPEEIFKNQLFVLEEVIRGVDPSQIIGIGISNQRETVVAWDKNTLKPVYFAISWQDNRNSKFVEQYSEYSELIKRKTGLYISEYFSASKIKWILENIDYPLENLRIGTIDSWLISNLTDNYCFATDLTNASRTLLFNLETETWDLELLDLFSIPISLLPEIKSSADFYGYWKEIPIYGVLGDQQSALLSLGIGKGKTICTYGTGLFLLINLGFEKVNLEGLITTVAWKLKGQSTVYALEYSFLLCGNLLEKLKQSGFFWSYELKDNNFLSSFYLDSLGLKLSFDGKEYRSVSFNLNLEKDKGDKVLKSVLNFYSLVVRDVFFHLKKYVYLEDKLYINGGISRIQYLKQIQKSVLDLNLCSFDNDGNNTLLGIAHLIFIFKNFHNSFNSSKKCNLTTFNKDLVYKLLDSWSEYKSSL